MEKEMDQIRAISIEKRLCGFNVAVCAIEEIKTNDDGIMKRD